MPNLHRAIPEAGETREHDVVPVRELRNAALHHPPIDEQDQANQEATSNNLNMAAAPYFKAHHPSHGYVASFKFAEDAAQYCASNGEGFKIYSKYKVLLWNEGHEEFSAYESFDRAAEVMHERDRASWKINKTNKTNIQTT